MTVNRRCNSTVATSLTSPQRYYNVATQRRWQSIWDFDTGGDTGEKEGAPGRRQWQMACHTRARRVAVIIDISPRRPACDPPTTHSPKLSTFILTILVIRGVGREGERGAAIFPQGAFVIPFWFAPPSPPSAILFRHSRVPIYSSNTGPVERLERAQHWFNAGPPSATLTRHWISTEPAFPDPIRWTVLPVDPSSADLEF